MKLNVGVIGGSIAGCAIAHLLLKSGAQVTVLERAKTKLINRGAGIVLPWQLLQKLVQLCLFDAGIPHTTAKGRAFYIQKKDLPTGMKIWQQPLEGAAFNWQDIYQNLVCRVPPENYVCNAEVVNLQCIGNHWQVQTAAKSYHFDFIIAADGINSRVRKTIFPDLRPTPANYVAWRGVTTRSDLKFDLIPYCMFDTGHIVLYQIPAPDFHLTGRTLVNWVMYENSPHDQLTLPPGHLSEQKRKYLHQLARDKLPPSIADIVCDAQLPFIQAIFDLQVPAYVKNKVCFIGDAATVLRPHTVSGLAKALMDGISLAQVFANADQDNLDQRLAIWNQTQIAEATQQVKLAKNMGRELVTNPPAWSEMNGALMNEWWQAVLQGMPWYLTQSTAPACKL